MMTLDEFIQTLSERRDEFPGSGSAPVMLWPKFPAGRATPITGALFAAFGPHRWIVVEQGKAVDPMAGG